MSLEQSLLDRSESKCELCKSNDNLNIYPVPPDSDGSIDQSALLCETCRDQIEDPAKIEIDHWRCLNDSMWNQTPAIQVLVWRMLNRLSHEGWPQDLLDMLYLDENTLTWAKATEEENQEEVSDHRDSNGALLQTGDSVTLIKDLNVKGGGFTAKRGTVVKGISLVPDNPEHIEGRVSGQQIVILTKFVKKAG